MLIPDNIHPNDTIYYNGSIVIQQLANNKTIDYLELYQKICNVKPISISMFTLCLDWLYLIDLITINEKGEILRCF